MSLNLLGFVIISKRELTQRLVGQESKGYFQAAEESKRDFRKIDLELRRMQSGYLGKIKQLNNQIKRLKLKK